MGRKKGSKNKKEPIRLDHDHEAHDELISKPLVENNDEQKEQNSKLNKSLHELTKQFGHSVIHFAKDEETKERISFIVPEVNKMIGGGIPYGTFSIIWGAKSCAKTTMTYYLIAQAQKQGKMCAYFDLENGFDKIWAEKCGIDLNKLLVGHFDNAEQAMDSLIKLSKDKSIDFVVIDSVQSLSPKGEQETKKGKEKSMEDDTMALLARKLSQFFRMSSGGVYTGKVAVLLIGQARINLGGFVKLETLSGGNALAHWSAMTIRVHRGQKADAPRYKFTIINKGKKKKKEIIIGFSLVIKIEKTKISGTAPEGTELRIPFYYEHAFVKPTEEQIKATYSDWIEMEKSIE